MTREILTNKIIGMLRKALIYVTVSALLTVTAVYASASDLSGRAGDLPLRVIVIDPGHGGEDTGAVGPRGLEEKDVTLSVAKRLKGMLEKKLNCTVLLTRTDDTYIPLEDRTSFANRNGADIFISIHANAARRRLARGVETYFLSFEASDDDARMVAAFENGIIGIDADGNGPKVTEDLKAILWDLTQNESLHQSSKLAEAIHTSVLSVTGETNRGVKQAHFIVLSGATMPAVLLEVGFITNPAEERRLSTERFQNLIAEAVAEGVVKYAKALRSSAGYVRLLDQ